jgi:hypothetical protein
MASRSRTESMVLILQPGGVVPAAAGAVLRPRRVAVVLITRQLGRAEPDAAGVEADDVVRGLHRRGVLGVHSRAEQRPLAARTTRVDHDVTLCRTRALMRGLGELQGDLLPVRVGVVQRDLEFGALDDRGDLDRTEAVVGLGSGHDVRLACVPREARRSVGAGRTGNRRRACGADTEPGEAESGRGGHGKKLLHETPLQVGQRIIRQMVNKG